MTTGHVVLRTGTADCPGSQIGLLAVRPDRLASLMRVDGSRLSFDLPGEEQVRIHLTSSAKPLGLLPDPEVALRRPGIVGVCFRGGSGAEFFVHFLGDGGPISTRPGKSDEMTWFEPPEGTSAVAFSMLVRGTGQAEVDGIEVILPPSPAHLPIGSLMFDLSEASFPVGPTSWPTAFSVEVVEPSAISVNGRRLPLVGREWASVDDHDRTWQLLVHGFSFAHNVVETLPRGAELIAEMLLDWAESHPIRPHSTTVMSWNDMAVAKRTMAILAVLDRLRFHRSPLLADLTGMLAVHAQWLAHPRNYLADHDHGLYSDTALEFAARALRTHPLADRWRRIARTRFHSTAARVIDSKEGTVREHSPAYVDAVAHLIAERRGDGLTDRLGDDLGDRFARTLAALTTPDEFLLPWGDTALTHRSPVPRASGATGFLQTGWAVSHHEESTLALTNSFHSRNHKHRDELSFLYYGTDGPVVFEAGFPGYGYGSADREYAESAQAHSGVLLDTIGPSGENPTPFGGAVAAPTTSGDWHALAGWNPIPTGSRHLRFLFHHPSTVVIVDLVTGQLIRGVTRIFHIGPKHGVEVDDRGSVRLGERTLALDWPRVPDIRVAPSEASRHFGKEYEPLPHTALLVTDHGPGVLTAVISPGSAPVHVAGVDVSGGRTGLEVGVSLRNGVNLMLSAIPADHPRVLRLRIS